MTYISRSHGVLIPGTGFVAGGGFSGFTRNLDELVEEAAALLQDAYGAVTIRFNSDRRSGGAWLVTSTGGGVGSDADIGICASLVSITNLTQTFIKLWGEAEGRSKVRQHIIDNLGGDPDGPDEFTAIYAHIGNSALRSLSDANNRTDDPWRCYLHKRMGSIREALDFVWEHALHPREFPQASFSEPMTIGKHEWRLRFEPGGTIAYEWRRLGNADWQGQRQWPSYDLNNGLTLGLPASLKKLWERERQRIVAHKNRTPLTSGQTQLLA